MAFGEAGITPASQQWGYATIRQGEKGGKKRFMRIGFAAWSRDSGLRADNTHTHTTASVLGRREREADLQVLAWRALCVPSHS